MSFYRVEDGSRFSGAHRPWATESAGEPDRTHYKETEVMQQEREACLSCPLPDCKPSSINCPVRNYKKVAVKKKAGRKRLEPPPVFIKYGKSNITNREWAEHLGVGKTTVANWRRELGYQRTRIDRRTKP